MSTQDLWLGIGVILAALVILFLVARNGGWNGGDSGGSISDSDRDGGGDGGGD
jgi:ABC-type cobalt transport system substrate-binding protein